MEGSNKEGYHEGLQPWAAISEMQHMQLYITWMVTAQHSKLLHVVTAGMVLNKSCKSLLEPAYSQLLWLMLGAWL